MSLLTVGRVFLPFPGKTLACALSAAWLEADVGV